ncbi:hypothetical protein DAI22_12g139100 [Oryza sativa Japonica Group]|nr:hypothetical protein DAI22_12g139100 [Oryza sativa Japonica Group]
MRLANHICISCSRRHTPLNHRRPPLLVVTTGRLRRRRQASLLHLDCFSGDGSGGEGRHPPGDDGVHPPPRRGVQDHKLPRRLLRPELHGERRRHLPPPPGDHRRPGRRRRRARRHRRDPPQGEPHARRRRAPRHPLQPNPAGGDEEQEATAAVMSLLERLDAAESEAAALAADVDGFDGLVEQLAAARERLVEEKARLDAIPVPSGDHRKDDVIVFRAADRFNRSVRVLREFVAQYDA